MILTQIFSRKIITLIKRLQEFINKNDLTNIINNYTHKNFTYSNSISHSFIDYILIRDSVSKKYKGWVEYDYLNTSDHNAVVGIIETNVNIINQVKEIDKYENMEVGRQERNINWKSSLALEIYNEIVEKKSNELRINTIYNNNDKINNNRKI